MGSYCTGKIARGLLLRKPGLKDTAVHLYQVCQCILAYSVPADPQRKRLSEQSESRRTHAALPPLSQNLRTPPDGHREVVEVCQVVLF